MFDKIPNLTYEKIGCSYVGSVVDDDGNVIFSNHLKWQQYGDAFAGRELSLKMKDGTIQKIKDHWFDHGSYEPHGDFVGIGSGTLKSLQDCYVYCSLNINKDTFQKMLNDYYSREREYGYDEIREWCKLQYKWYNVIINGKQYPYMVNERGSFVHRYSKEAIYPRVNRCICKFKSRGKSSKSFDLCLFKLEYNDGDKVQRIERKMLDVLKESLPFNETEIIKKCKLPQQ